MKLNDGTVDFIIYALITVALFVLGVLIGVQM